MMDISEALEQVQMLATFMEGKYPRSTRRDEVCLALRTVAAEVTRLRQYVGTNDLHSDFQSVDHMRRELEHLKKELDGNP